MKLSDSVKSSLKLAHTANFVNDELYLKLLQNCFSVLKGNSELHSKYRLLYSFAFVFLLSKVSIYLILKQV